MGNQPAILKISKPNVFKSDSVILITGASSGIGREIAYQYSQRNCRLFWN
jgi:short-subunit dehydrogenase